MIPYPAGSNNRGESNVGSGNLGHENGNSDFFGSRNLPWDFGVQTLTGAEAGGSQGTIPSLVELLPEGVFPPRKTERYLKGGSYEPPY